MAMGAADAWRAAKASGRAARTKSERRVLRAIDIRLSSVTSLCVLFLLVPKLCLGTHVLEALLRACGAGSGASKLAFPSGAWERVGLLLDFFYFDHHIRDGGHVHIVKFSFGPNDYVVVSRSGVGGGGDFQLSFGLAIRNAHLIRRESLHPSRRL